VPDNAPGRSIAIFDLGCLPDVAMLWRNEIPTCLQAVAGGKLGVTHFASHNLLAAEQAEEATSILYDVVIAKDWGPA